MVNKKLGFFYIFLLYFFLLSSCLQISQENPTPSSARNISETSIPSTHTITSLQFTSSPTATPAIPPEVRCPTPNIDTTMFETMNGYDAEQAILAYLNHGGSPDLLQEEINKLGSIVNSSQVFIIDINNDDVSEIVLAINFNPPENGYWENAYGVVSMYSCTDGSYTTTNITEEKQGRITIISVENLSGLKTPEILVAKQILVSSCDEFVEMYSQEETSWLSLFKSDESPCLIRFELRNNESGYKELIIEGKRGCSYASCGPVREKKWVYEFRDDETKLIHEELLPSPYRIHVLEDGDIAIKRGDLDASIEIYGKAALDDTLIDAVTLSEQEKQFSEDISFEELQKTAHIYQTSFAFFRKFVLLHYLNRDDEAETVLNYMKTIYLEGKNGSELVDISLYFLDQIKSSRNAREACRLTNEYLANKYILSANDFVYSYLNGWGDFSPQIGELLCPEIK
jgi:hypothetical protein